ncbi:hypothetical protein AAFN60_04460 [Roseibacillus persicicus]|uniref:hypothetical protein n=1 Tax=Roseibacillus persicicus TaxID=454148 RepID=UPI00398B0C16
MDRRDWLKLAGPTAVALSHGTAFGAESTGKWSDEGRIEYSGLLMEWLKNDFELRAKRLELLDGKPCDLSYDYLLIGDDRKKERTFERFAEGRLSDRQAFEHIEKSLAEYELVRQELAALEKAAALKWKVESAKPKMDKGYIYGMEVNAGRLGVILDGSRSMTRYLEKLREEIARDFPEAHIVEVNGCHLDRAADVPWFYASAVPDVNPFTPDRHIPVVPQADARPFSHYISWTRSLPSAIVSMVYLMKVDAIYWFCDFDDDDDEDVIKYLARIILDQKVKLFVHTVDKRPPSLISLLAEKSGGEVIKKRI